MQPNHCIFHEKVMAACCPLSAEGQVLSEQQAKLHLGFLVLCHVSCKAIHFLKEGIWCGVYKTWQCGENHCYALVTLQRPTVPYHVMVRDLK